MEEITMQYYDSTELRSKKDLDGLPPEIWITCGNRAAGKSYNWKKFLLEEYINNGKKFMLVMRWVYEISDAAIAFYKDLEEIDFPGHTMEDVGEKRGLYKTITFDGKECGYCVYLNSADALKKCSSRFTDVDYMFLDEFQSETGKYCDDEVKKLMSIHSSVARGKGEQTRRVPLIMCSNLVSLINPYFCALGIHKRIRDNTHFLRGKGWVLEFCFSQTAAKASKDSRFNQAFSDNKYFDYLTNPEYLLNNNSFVEKRSLSNGTYECTVKSNGISYGIWSLNSVLYCSEKYDPNFPYKIAATIEDHDTNTLIVKRHSFQVMKWREYFQGGLWRFENLNCKEAIINLIAY